MATTLSTDYAHLDCNSIFTSYAEAYDLLLEISPPYQELLSLTNDYIEKYIVDLSDGKKFLDIGAGTGNFSNLLVKQRNPTEIHLLDCNDNMLAQASTKINSPYIIKHCTTFDAFIPKVSYDVVFCFHTLYLMRSPKLMIPKMRQAIDKDGILIICDIGKPINVIDWTIYLFLQSVKKIGFKSTIELHKNCKNLIDSNSKIYRYQKSTKWTHNLRQFRTHFEPFFEVLEAETVYRGYSNMLVCKAK